MSSDQSGIHSTVYVVDDDASMRRSLCNLVESMGWQVEAFAAAPDFLATKRPNAPCCLVLDVRLPGLSGLDFQAKLAGAKIDIPIIFVTGHGDIPMSVRAMKGGAVEFLTKPFREQDLLDAIQVALDQHKAKHQSQRETSELRTKFETLTPREKEVMTGVTRGLLNKQIAAEIGITENTVKMHRGQATKKLGAKSVADLVRMVDSLGNRQPS